MKEFRFELHITVYAETEDEARRAFCEDLQHGRLMRTT